MEVKLLFALAVILATVGLITGHWLAKNSENGGSPTEAENSSVHETVPSPRSMGEATNGWPVRYYAAGLLAPGLVVESSRDNSLVP